MTHPAAGTTEAAAVPHLGVTTPNEITRGRLSRFHPRPTLLWTLIWFALIRFATVLMVFGFRPVGRDLLNDHGDIAWYVSIAEHGYRLAEVVGQTHITSNMAFFPLTPTLMKPLMLLGVPALWAGLVVSSAASIVAAWALYRIGDHLYGQRVGCCLALSWGCFLPTSIALSLPLSEAVFTAGAAWTCYFLLTDRMIAAAGMTVLAGLSRPSAIALLAAVVWVAVSKLIKRQEVWRSIAAIAVAPVGLAGYFLYVTARTGSWNGYSAIQRTYDSQLDFGAYWIHKISAWFQNPPTNPVDLVAISTAVVALALLALLFVKRVPAPLVVYAVAALLLIVIQSGHIDVLQRFIVPIFPLLIPVAIGLAKLRWWLLAPIVVAMTYLTANYGAFLLYVTRRNII